MNIETKCVQSGYSPKNGDPRVLPLFQSTTYLYETGEQLADLFNLTAPGHIYSRISNPTVDAFEQKIASLEGGVGALATSSGLAAETIAILNVCYAGDNIISLPTIYGGSYNLFNVTLRKYGIDTRFISQSADDAAFERLIDDKTKAIYCETLANPGMTITDFDKLSRLAKKHNILLICDNTLATPILCQPFKHGVNIVVHSTTKYIDGHASCVGGMIVDGGNFDFSGNPRYADFGIADESYHGLVYNSCAPAAFITKARVQLMRDLGSCQSPFNAYLTNLGAETLHLRMERHSSNALAVAELLSTHPQVEWVRYPGLTTDPDHAIANKYFEGKGFSGMVVFGIKGGRAAAAEFMKKLSLIKIVTHIADTRSCVLHPATTTHRQLSDSDLIAAGVSDNLLRLSIGIEDACDIIADITNAFN